MERWGYRNNSWTIAEPAEIGIVSGPTVERVASFPDALGLVNGQAQFFPTTAGLTPFRLFVLAQFKI
jgi:hypothetical protein